MFGFKGSMAENDQENPMRRKNEHGGVANIGTPRMKRSIKLKRLDNNRGIEEVQFQICVCLPSKIFDSKSDMQKLFEETISYKVKDIHLEMMRLESAGKIAGFTTGDCEGKLECDKWKLNMTYSGVQCENYLDKCLTCKGHEALAEIEIISMENMEIISSQRCITNIDALREIEDGCIQMLR